MKRFVPILILAVFATGCTTVQTESPGTPTFIFPDSWYVKDGKRCLLEDMKKSFQVPDDEALYQAVKDLGPNMRDELKDPFVQETLPFVMFDSSRPGEEIATFYQRAFRAAGWKETRGILTVEYTNGGGDWLRVYSRDTQMVLIHIMGPMATLPTDTPESFAVRTITLRFRGIAPEEFLGPGFRKQNWNPMPAAER